MATTGEITTAIYLAERQADTARRKYVSACRTLADDLTRAADRAEGPNGYCTDTPANSSLVADVIRYAGEHRVASEYLLILKGLVAAREVQTWLEPLAHRK